MARTYKIYVSNPVLIDICDELIRNGELSATITRLMMNGLGKDIQKTKKELQKRINKVSSIDHAYKILKKTEIEKKETVYNSYCEYRKSVKDAGYAYVRNDALSWIEKAAKKLMMDKKLLLNEFEMRYEQHGRRRNI